MKMLGKALCLTVLTSLVGCGTYYDPEPYVRGVRYYDRGLYGVARETWEPLVVEGDCDAEFRLGLLYFLAQGVDRDIPKALSLWTIAANQGQPRAQYALGDVFFKNADVTRLFCRYGCEDVKQDLPIAYKWYLLAEKSAGYDNDKKYINHVLPAIRSSLTSEQKRIGEEAAADWKPSPHSCKPRVLW